jgi:UTP--glucose-1-phosphate uridylyltransferase
MDFECVDRLIRQKMGARGIDSSGIDDFLQMVGRIGRESSGYVPLDQAFKADAARLISVPSHPDSLRLLENSGRHLLSRVAVVKLNGGRATTMGGRMPKGIVEAKCGLSYLEIILRQTDALRRAHSADFPLVLMNSFFTHEPTMEIVNRFDVPVWTFIQTQVPRLREDTLEPLDTGTDEDWTPPGHGDVYGSLRRSGLLDRLRENGIKWAFISNLDNLAACLEPWILGLIERDNIDFLLEVTDRTEADLKGGTLVVRNGGLDLLEIAQVAPEERDKFMDIHRFPVFNTNNVWVDLDALSHALDTQALQLPIIQNRKNILGTKVIQLETAMGAAVASFPRARGLRVGRDRFFPTKRIGGLFVLQSDACELDSLFRIRRNTKRSLSLPYRPLVVFSGDFMDSPEKMGECFEDPASVSLIDAFSLEVSGKAYFERDVKVVGKVKIEVPPGQYYRITRGTVLKDGCYP